jgi:cell division protein FtsB
MSPLLFQQFRNSLSYLWLIAAAGYLAVSASQAVIRNYHSQEEINDLEAHLADLKLEKQRLDALVIYYKTDAYKEKQLRQNLLLAKPNETVYALPEAGNVRSLEDEALKPASAHVAVATVDPYWQQWLDYLF